VALDSVIYEFQKGRSPEAIQDAFPALSLSQVYRAIAYYLDHQAEPDQYLAQNEATEEDFSREVARLFPKGAALKARIKQKAAGACQMKISFQAEEYVNQIIRYPLTDSQSIHLNRWDLLKYVSSLRPSPRSQRLSGEGLAQTRAGPR